MAARVGAGLAGSALDGLKQNGAIQTYDFPFAGTAEQKAAWTAANSQTLLGFLNTEFRSASEDEKLYNSVGQSTQIAKAQEQDAEIGQIALLPEEGVAGIAAVGALRFGEAVTAGSAAGGALPSTLDVGTYGADTALELGSSAKGGVQAVDGALPNAGEAVIDPNKLTSYALNPQHPVGGDKARVFESALGYNQSNADQLIGEIQQGVLTNPAVMGKVDQFGQRFTVDMPITGPNGNIVMVRTGWVLDPGATVPRLATAYVK